MKDKDKEKKNRAEYGHMDVRDEIKRLNRVIGQIDGIRKMLEEQRKLSSVLMQCKAVHSALKSIESRIVKAHLEAAMDDIAKMDKKKDRIERLEAFEELFKHAS